MAPWLALAALPDLLVYARESPVGHRLVSTGLPAAVLFAATTALVGNVEPFASQAQVVWTAIAPHTTPGIPGRMVCVPKTTSAQVNRYRSVDRSP